ncbi:Hypothetical_protein [Hexamita inflata]|uniref:Hypothetical_protein n=1 Tax=Hexamita inflata TaxID=28002 RepID=A0AA86NA54_9EUKA|nr:Hypothetical protein HINF_LOCUS3564 [Hexamita inflata]
MSLWLSQCVGKQYLCSGVQFLESLYCNRWYLTCYYIYVLSTQQSGGQSKGDSLFLPLKPLPGLKFVIIDLKNHLIASPPASMHFDTLSDIESTNCTYSLLAYTFSNIIEFLIKFIQHFIDHLIQHSSGY